MQTRFRHFHVNRRPVFNIFATHFCNEDCRKMSAMASSQAWRRTYMIHMMVLYLKSWSLFHPVIPCQGNPYVPIPIAVDHFEKIRTLSETVAIENIEVGKERPGYPTKIGFPFFFCWQLHWAPRQSSCTRYLRRVSFDLRMGLDRRRCMTYCYLGIWNCQG